MTARRTCVVLHQCLGLTVGVMLAITGLTGSVLVFREEIDTTFNAGLLRVVATSEMVPLEQVVEQVQQAYPRSRIFSLRMPRERGDVYEVRLNSNAGRRVYIAPNTGHMLGSHEACERLMDLMFCLHS